MPEWQWRYYSYSTWETGESVFSMRDGSGDEMFVVFVNKSVLVKGFAHESSYTPYRTSPPEVLPGMFDGIPNELQHLLTEPALLITDTTFCFWWEDDGNKKWRYGRKPALYNNHLDGSQSLLQILDGNPETYHRWAIGYYEKEVSSDAVMDIYIHKPLSKPLIMSLNPDRDIQSAFSEANEIGYPVLST